MCLLSGKSYPLGGIQLIRVKVSLFTGEFWHFLLICYHSDYFYSRMHSSRSVSILEAVSVHLCHLQLCFSINRWTQTNINDILCHGDCMYLHALTNKIVPDANSLSIEELPQVATSQNNVEYRLNYNKFYQGHIDRSICGDGPFCSLKQVN